MILGIYTDPHWCMNSSILSASHGQYGQRLESLIDSYRWMYDVFGKDVDAIVNGGDLTDNTYLKSEEITAISKAFGMSKGVPEYHLLGNHEKQSESSTFHSLSMLNLLPNFKVIDKPQRMDINPDVSFLPYTHKPKLSTIRELEGKVLFSHITVLGSYLTSVFKASSGLDTDYLDDCFDLVINGHIHSSQWVSKKVLNLGVMAGVSFNDSYKLHYPSIAILDTDTLELKIISNPHAIRFIKIEVDTVAGLTVALSRLEEGNYALQLRVPYDIRSEARRLVSTNPLIVASRISTKIDSTSHLKIVELDKVTNKATGREALTEFIENRSKLPHKKSEILKAIDNLYS
ncbi:putative exonuclease [Listeria phage LIS04]|nr:putative exonuclease [Listeria phage LIS04]